MKQLSYVEDLERRIMRLPERYKEIYRVSRLVEVRDDLEKISIEINQYNKGTNTKNGEVVNAEDYQRLERIFTEAVVAIFHHELRVIKNAKPEDVSITLQRLMPLLRSVVNIISQYKDPTHGKEGFFSANKYIEVSHDLLAQADDAITLSLRKVENKTARALNSKTISNIIQDFARLRWKPSAALEKHWMQVVEQEPDDAISIDDIMQRIYSMGVLRMRPTAQLLEKYFSVLNAEAKISDRATSKILYGLAMLHAGGVGVLQMKGGEAAVSKLAALTNISHDLPSSKDAESAPPSLYSKILYSKRYEKYLGYIKYVGLTYFDKPAAIPAAKNVEESGQSMSLLEDSFYRKATQEIKQHEGNLKAARLTVSVEKQTFLPLMQALVDVKVTCEGRHGKSVVWLELDGPQHFLKNKRGESILRGQDLLQEVLVKRVLPKNEAIMRISYLDMTKKEDEGSVEYSKIMIEEKVRQVISQSIELYNNLGSWQEFAIRKSKTPPQSRRRS